MKIIRENIKLIMIVVALSMLSSCVVVVRDHPRHHWHHGWHRGY